MGFLGKNVDVYPVGVLSFPLTLITVTEKKDKKKFKKYHR